MSKNPSNRDDWLLAEDSELLDQCRIEATRGSGPGGQKRNKTSSAIRLTHQPSGISVRAEDSRKQSSNCRNALLRLRMAIALGVRLPAESPDGTRKFRSRDPSDVAIVLDHLSASGFVISDTAQRLETSTAQLSTFICQNPTLLASVNRERALIGLKPLRAR